MHGQVGDRLVLHGRDGTRIGVIVEAEESGMARIQWADGGESALSTLSEGSEQEGHAAWKAAKAGPAVTWRRGVTAGVGREASLAQAKLATEVVDDAAVAQVEASPAVAVPPEGHQQAAGE